MVAAVQRVLLRVWRRVPRRVRQWIVRAVSPSFTVGAACVIERGDGSILLVRLAYRDRWGLPGGLLKRHEDVSTCARREVREEIGLDVDLVSEPAVVVDSRPQRVDVVFLARPAAEVDPASASPRSVEILEVGWFPAGDLPDLQHEAMTALMALASSTLGPVGTPVAPAPAGADGGSGSGRGEGDAGDDESGRGGSGDDESGRGGSGGGGSSRGRGEGGRGKAEAGDAGTLRLAAAQAAGQWRRSLAS